MKKYRTVTWMDKIEEAEITRETDKCIYVKYGSVERREQKASGTAKYFDTWDEAHNHLVQRTKDTISGLRDRILRENAKLGMIAAMTKP